MRRVSGRNEELVSKMVTTSIIGSEYQPAIFTIMFIVYVCLNIKTAIHVYYVTSYESYHMRVWIKHNFWLTLHHVNVEIDWCRIRSIRVSIQIMDDCRIFSISFIWFIHSLESSTIAIVIICSVKGCIHGNFY